MHLTDIQWEAVKTYIPPPSRKDRRGRPRRDDRATLEAILWVLRSGATWSQLPNRYPPRSTCHDRFQAWKRSGVLLKLLKALADDLIERSELNINAGYIAALFAPAGDKNALWAPIQPAMTDNLWAQQTLTLFTSPSTWRVLPPAKARWLKRHVREGLYNRIPRNTVLKASERSSPFIPLRPAYQRAARKALS